MPDIVPEVVNSVKWNKSGTIATGTRIVIVLNPTTLTGGTTLFDATVPVGKTFDGNIYIMGELK